jgi:hypothetical protein
MKYLFQDCDLDPFICPGEGTTTVEGSLEVITLKEGNVFYYPEVPDDVLYIEVRLFENFGLTVIQIKSRMCKLTKNMIKNFFKLFKIFTRVAQPWFRFYHFIIYMRGQLRVLRVHSEMLHYIRLLSVTTVRMYTVSRSYLFFIRF